MGIRLSRKHGVNPHLTTCPRCGKDGDTIILSGWSHKYECGQCHQIHIGIPDRRECQKCGGNNLIDQGEPPPEEKFNALCSACEKEIQNIRNEIAAGGVPFQCSACHCEGVIRGTTEFATSWKAEHGKAGVDFAGINCPMCEKGVKREIHLADSDKHDGVSGETPVS